MGAHLLPSVPSLYHRPKSIEDIIDQAIGKVLNYIGIWHNLFSRRGEHAQSENSVKRINGM